MRHAPPPSLLLRTRTLSRGGHRSLCPPAAAAPAQQNPLEQLLATLSGNSPAKRAAAKSDVLDAIAPLSRGATASEDDKEEVEAAVQRLERLNPHPASLACPLINGKARFLEVRYVHTVFSHTALQWELLYTTSTSILRTSAPPFFRPGGPIYQTIDTARLRAKNQETWPLFASVTAELTPTSKSAVRVQFKTFRLLGFIPVTAPAAAVGALNTTYVDDEIRISRGDKGNLFVLRMASPEAELADKDFEAGIALGDVFGVKKSVESFQ